MPTTAGKLSPRITLKNKCSEIRGIPSVKSLVVWTLKAAAGKNPFRNSFKNPREVPYDIKWKVLALFGPMSSNWDFFCFVSGFSVIHRITKACSAGDGISHFTVIDLFFFTSVNQRLV